MEAKSYPLDGSTLSLRPPMLAVRVDGEQLVVQAMDEDRQPVLNLYVGGAAEVRLIAQAMLTWVQEQEVSDE